MNRGLRGACEASMRAFLSILFGKFVFDIVELGIGVFDECLEGFGIHLAGLLMRLIELFDRFFDLFLLGVGTVNDAGGALPRRQT